MTSHMTTSSLAGQRHYVLATDGACIPNPGPGGWGAVLQIIEADGTLSFQRPMAGCQTKTTNNQMEMRAAIKALSRLSLPELPAVVLTDSQIVVKGMTEWMAGWKARNWRKAGGKPVENQDLWQELDVLCQSRVVVWQWVRGHAGHHLNEMADTLANSAAEREYAKPGHGLKDRHADWFVGSEA